MGQAPCFLECSPGFLVSGGEQVLQQVLDFCTLLITEACRARIIPAASTLTWKHSTVK